MNEAKREEDMKKESKLTKLAREFNYSGESSIQEVYYNALRELISAGHARPEYDPLEEDRDARFIFLGESFILYVLTDAAVEIDFIYVDPAKRGTGLATKMLILLEELIKSKPSWPKLMKAEILSGNKSSFKSFKAFQTRSVILEKYIP